MLWTDRHQQQCVCVVGASANPRGSQFTPALRGPSVSLVGQAPRPVSQPCKWTRGRGFSPPRRSGQGSCPSRPSAPSKCPCKVRPAAGPSLAPPPPSQTCRSWSSRDQLANNGERLLQGLHKSCHSFLKDFVTAAPHFLGLL